MSSAHTLTELYDQFAAPAYSLAFTITQHGSAAERVVTEAFASTWQQLEREPASEHSFFSALMTADPSAQLASSICAA